MTADHLSYKRATTVCVIGMAIQGVLATITLLYGLLSSDNSDIAAINGSFAMYLGLPIWFSLSLVFHQHKLERLEALEAEAYRTSAAAQASVFEGIGQDQTVQATRLAWMHKWFLPAMSLLVGGGYIGLATWLWPKSRLFSQLGNINGEPPSGWAISVGMGVAILAFIFGRFVAGMAKQKVWSLLHAGSASAVLCSLVGALLVIVHFTFVTLRWDTGLLYAPLVMDAAMAALGAEMLLHFVLNLYRPRKAGEWLRPAFDSRVLAFIAAPDRLAASISDAINYQFGFNVSSTWFYRLIARSVFPLVALVVLTLWGLTCLVVVRPHQRALVLRGGQLAEEVGPGLVVKKPWPLDDVIIYPASAVNQLRVGTSPPDKDGPILWTNEHSGEETLMLVQPWGAAAGVQASDLALLAVEVPIHYTVRDLKSYKRLAQDAAGDEPDKTRQELLTAAASSVVIKHLATFTVDALLGDKRADVAQDLKIGIQKQFDAMDAGVDVSFVGVSGVHPKQTVAPAFEDVVAKDQVREKTIEDARKTEIEKLASVAGTVDTARAIIALLDDLDKLKSGPKPDAGAAAAIEAKVMERIESAGGEAAAMLSQAKAARWQRSIGERAKAVRSEGQIASYRAAPLAYKAGVYLDALRVAARGAKVYISPFPNLQVQGNYEDIEPDVSGFKPAKLEGDQENQR